MEKRTFFLSLFTIGLVFFTHTYAQKPKKSEQLEIKPTIKNEYLYQNNMRINKKTNIPIALYNVNYAVSANQPKKMAREYLHKNIDELGLLSDINDLHYVSTQETPGGSRVRFQQYIKGYPVHEAVVVVSINKKNEVIFVMNNQFPEDNPTKQNQLW